MTYDQAQSPRLGQKLPPESPGLRLLTLNTLPEAAFRGQVVYLTDQQEFSIYDGTAWQQPSQVAGGAGSQIFVGPDAPVADHIGDQWYETDTGQLYVWMDFEGTPQWRPIVDPLAQQLDARYATDQAAVQDQFVALGAAVDGKITTFYDSVMPASASDGDLWINQVDNKLYRWDASLSPAAWVEIQDYDIAAAYAAAGQAKSIADGKIDSYYSDDPPWANDTAGHALDDGDLWIDTNDNKKLYRWSGTTWVDVGDARITANALAISGIDTQFADIGTQLDKKVSSYFQSAAPWANGDATHGADDGDLWFDTTTKILKRWDGTTIGQTQKTWVQIKDQQMIDAYNQAGQAQTTANAKISHYINNTSPWNNGDATHALDAGDIWTQTPDNLKYFWNDNLKAWVSLPVGPNAVTSDVMNYKIITGATLQTSTTNVNTVRIDLSGIKIYGATSGVTVFEATNTGVLNLKTELNAAGGSIRGGVVYGGTLSSATSLSGGLPTGARVDISSSYVSTIKMYAGLSSESPAIIESYNSGGYGQLNFTSPTTGGLATASMSLISANLFSNNVVTFSAMGSGAITLNAGSGGVQVSSGAGFTVNSGGIHVTGTSNFQNNLTVANGANFTVASGGAINFNGPLNMNGAGIGTVGGSGLTIDSGGLLVKSGGVIVNAGGGGVTAQGITATSSFTNSGLVGGQTTTCTINTSNQYVRTGSTRRIKKDIADLSESLVEKILALPPRMFRYNEDQLMGDWLHAGFIAEEADDLDLDLWVSRDGDGEITSFDYLGFTAGLLLTIQSLASRIETLEG